MFAVPEASAHPAAVLAELHEPHMRVLICGSRTWTDAAAIQRALEDLPPGPTTIIHGGARGADQLAGKVAVRLGYAVEAYEADWSLGGRAGPERNIRMLDSKPDLVLAFWDGRSRGTGHTVTEARRRNITVDTVTMPVAANLTSPEWQ
jgi:hypothetical protein